MGFYYLAGIAGALSWLFISPLCVRGTRRCGIRIDLPSIVFVVILAAIFLGRSIYMENRHRRASDGKRGNFIAF